MMFSLAMQWLQLGHVIFFPYNLQIDDHWVRLWFLTRTTLFCIVLVHTQHPVWAGGGDKKLYIYLIGQKRKELCSTFHDRKKRGICGSNRWPLHYNSINKNPCFISSWFIHNIRYGPGGGVAKTIHIPYWSKEEGTLLDFFKSNSNATTGKEKVLFEWRKDPSSNKAFFKDLMILGGL